MKVYNMRGRNLTRAFCNTQREYRRVHDFCKSIGSKKVVCVLVWTEDILKTNLFENDDITIIM